MIDLLGLLLTNQYATLIFVDMLRGIFGTYGWGFPLWTGTVGTGTTVYNWTGAFMLLYVEEWFCWFIFPLISMIWWRGWAKKNPTLVEEL